MNSMAPPVVSVAAAGWLDAVGSAAAGAGGLGVWFTGGCAQADAIRVDTRKRSRVRFLIIITVDARWPCVLSPELRKS